MWHWQVSTAAEQAWATRDSGGAEMGRASRV